MSKKKKILIISLSVVVGIIALLLILSYTLFALKSVTIDYRTSTLNITASDEQIIDDGNFNYGQPVYFQFKRNHIKKIEKANPYIKVINIETVFPSKFIVHIAERQEVYAFKNDDQYIICDETYKVLKISDEFTSSQTNALLVEGAFIQNQEINVGEYLQVNQCENIYNVLYEQNYTLGEQTSLIKQISFKEELDEEINKNQLTCQIQTFDNVTFILKNCSYGLKYKVKLFLNVYSQLYTFIGKEVVLDNGTSHTLTEEDLNECKIEIRNYYDYTNHGEKECYFKILLS